MFQLETRSPRSTQRAGCWVSLETWALGRSRATESSSADLGGFKHSGECDTFSMVGYGAILRFLSLVLIYLSPSSCIQTSQTFMKQNFNLRLHPVIWRTMVLPWRVIPCDARYDNPNDVDLAIVALNGFVCGQNVIRVQKLGASGEWRGRGQGLGS